MLERYLLYRLEWQGEYRHLAFVVSENGSDTAVLTGQKVHWIAQQEGTKESTTNRQSLRSKVTVILRSHINIEMNDLDNVELPKERKPRNVHIPNGGVHQRQNHSE